MSNDYTIPQYLRTDDPETVAVCLANEEGRNAWGKLAHEWGQKHGIPRTVGGEVHTLMRGSFGSYRIVGVTGAKPTSGQWKALKNGWAPFAKNPLNKEMASITFENAKVPGLPSMVMGAEGNDGLLMMYPTPFIHDGAAWVQLSARGSSSEHLGPQWVEVLGSQVMAAHEQKYPKERTGV